MAIVTFVHWHFIREELCQLEVYSIVNEAKKIIWDPDFKGYIHDVGGPTANFRGPACAKQLDKGACKDRQCLFPTACKAMKIDHKDYVTLLRKLRELPKVKKVFVRSGIRYDYLIYDKDETFFNELCEHHISGQLKVAPEHVSSKVLEKWGNLKEVCMINLLKDIMRLIRN